jgi:2-dehydropantoate 2-reductase
VGAGGVGGYFGGRLLEAGRDVTFLVRPARAARLESDGLRICSTFGDVHIANPPTVIADALHEAFDVVLLSCKAYDLEAAMESVAGGVGTTTAIVPLLNGMKHLDSLDGRFGADRVMGGRCLISAAVEADGTIAHFNNIHVITFGERDGSSSARVDAIAGVLGGAKFESHASGQILLDMWEKWVFIAAGAGINCLMRATVGEIEAAGGAPLANALLEECAAVATAAGYPPSAGAIARSRVMLTTAGSGIMASMLRDIERGGPTEAEHVVGDLLRRGRELAVPTHLLEVVHVHLRAYEVRRAAGR